MDGVEVEVGVLGNSDPVASLPGEIVPLGHDWYDFASKYEDGGMDLVIPPRGLANGQIRRVQEVAVDAFRVTDCEGMARVDCFVADGEVIVNELNTIPGFTSTSVYAKLFAASGIAYRTSGPLDRACARATRAAGQARVLAANPPVPR